MLDRRTLPLGSFETITGNENLLVLAPSPLDESLAVGGLIAQSCKRGRQPFVMVLEDGTSSHPNSACYPPDRLAQVHDRETRQAVSQLGLIADRLLMAGVYDGHIPDGGELFDVVVRAVTLVMWARDCNVICAPCLPDDGYAAERAAHRIAEAVAASSGVGLLLWATEHACAPADLAGAIRLDIAAELEAKQRAIAAHASKLGKIVLDDPAPNLPVVAAVRNYETYIRRT